jgi:hypothetical protein
MSCSANYQLQKICFATVVKDFYIFEFEYNYKNSKNILRKIKNTKVGCLINENDDINYDNINSFVLNVFSINENNVIASFKEKLNDNTTAHYFINKKIQLSLSPTFNNKLELNYKIIS